MKLTVSTTINAPIEKVWEALWKPEHIVHWCFASRDWHCPKALWEEPVVGGIFSNTFAAKDGSFSFDLVGKYDVVEPLQRIVYTMGEMKEYFLEAGRQVEVVFEKVTSPLTPLLPGEGKGTGVLGWGWEKIQITETFDAEDIHPHEMQIAGWQAILENFKKYVEGAKW